MKTLGRLVMSAAMTGFFVLASGCILAPPPEHEHEHDRDGHEEHHCDDRDRDCRDH